MAIILLCMATVLAVLLAADRLAPRLVGNRVAAGLQTALDTDQRPVVRFDGFPFVTQIVSRHYQRVSIMGRDIAVPGTDGHLKIDEFDATLADARPDATYRRITIGRLTTTETIGYASLSDYVGTQISYDNLGDPNGYISIAIGGPFAMTGKPVVDPQADQVDLVGAEFRIGDRVLPGANDRDPGDLFWFPMPELISGMRLSGVRAGPNGLVLTASGDNLKLRR